MAEKERWRSHWLRVGPLECLPPGKGKQVRVLGRAIAVFNTGEGLLAVDGTCRHMNAPLVHGRLCQARIKCKWHGWEYDLRDGRCLTKPRARLRAYPVKVDNGTVFVDAGSILAGASATESMKADAEGAS